ncbi:hypothetical protein HHK36_012529 [Tetracentron sinense]|uniref:SBP-type domain-containing protein n=1 Tax=Tetracentron sinense TaxID=13715 RepID=A0A835DIR7_TETSI|nr:hypothetical protein HHK36_012529 [Tetracentron sinense]
MEKSIPLSPNSNSRVRVSDMEIPHITDESSTLWEWDSLLDFALDDHLNISWDSGNQTAAEPVSLPASEIGSEPSNQGSSDGSDRVRKRDPRLTCSNFLAGRIPCACPELDEKEEEEEGEGEAKKRARTVTARTARCQVPGCEADIRELKGYHRRHRVCLSCANASEVLIDGQCKRYCQQCGKFHILLDFDEGKRSCRRKLERHNNRRRRKAIDFRGAVEKEPQGGLPAEGVSCDAEAEKDSLCVSNQIMGREALLESEDGHASPLCSAPNSQNIQSDSVVSFVASGEAQMEGGKDNSKYSISSSFCDNKSAYSSMCPTGRISFKLYDWNPAEFPRRLRHQIFKWLSSMPVELEGYIRPGCTILTVFIAMPCFMWEKVMDLLNASHDFCEVFSPEVLDLTEDDLIEKFAIGVSMVTSLLLAISYPTLAAAPHMFINAHKNVLAVAVATEYSFPQADKVKEYLEDPTLKRLLENRTDPQQMNCCKPVGKQPTASLQHNRNKRLLQFLHSGTCAAEHGTNGPLKAKLPPQDIQHSTEDDELEAPVLSKDAASYVHDFVSAPECMLSGRGSILVDVNNMIFRILKDGTSVMNVKVEVRAPRLHYVHPTCFEAGKPMEFVACGSNLLQSKFRFLVSFAGKYLAYDSCVAIPHGKTESYIANSCDHQIYKIYIPHTEPKLFGPAFIEVENEAGLSNFIPVLFGDKEICSEINIVQQRFDEFLCSKRSLFAVNDSHSDLCEVSVSRQTAFSELLLDIAWLLKEPRLENIQTLLTSRQFQRFNWLLNFLVQNEYITILEKILESLKFVMDKVELHSPINRTDDADMRLFQKYINHAREVVCQRLQQSGGLVLQSGNSVPEGDCFSQSCTKNDELFVVPSTNQDMEMREEAKLGAMVTSDFSDSSETVPLVYEEVVMNVNLVKVPPRKSCGRLLSNTITGSRLVLIGVTVALCFGICAVLLHPHQIGEFVVTVHRCLFDKS